MLTIARRAKQYLIAAIVLGCFVPGAFAATANLILVDPTGNAPYDGVYVGPYQISLDGGATTVEAICLDYQYTTNQGDTWTADVSGVGGDPILQDQAYLASKLVSAAAAGDTTAAAEYQYAIWALSPINPLLVTPTSLTVQAVLLSIFLGSDSNPSIDGHAFVLAVGNDVQDALNNASAYDSSGVSVYSPNAPPQPDVSAMQRFMTVPPSTSMPEPPVLAVLGVDFSAVGALIFVLRRRITA